MTTLIAPQVATLIDRLFADAAKTEVEMGRYIGQLSPAEQAALTDGSSDNRAFYHQAKDIHMAVSRDAGRLLYMLARAGGARSIIEFGTSFAISTLHLASALRDNGGGRLITTEFEPSKAVHARGNIAAAGFADMVELREGDARETLARDLPDVIDFVFLDGAKALYPHVLALLDSRLKPGTLIVADNADWSPEYLARVRAPGGGYLSVPFGADVEVSLRL